MIPDRLGAAAAIALVLAAAAGLLAGGSATAMAAGNSGIASSPPLPACPVRPTTNNCTVTLRYWRNHPESWIQVTSLTLGTVTYDQAQIHDIMIMRCASVGNGLVLLAHQLLAAKLNLLWGAVPPPRVAAAIAQADALIGSKVVPPIGSDHLSLAQIAELDCTLFAFNVGAIGPGRCPGWLDVTETHTPTWGSVKSIYR